MSVSEEASNQPHINIKMNETRKLRPESHGGQPDIRGEFTYLVESHYAHTVRVAVIVERAQLFELGDDTPNLKLDILDTLPQFLHLAPETKGLVITVLARAATGVVPVGDGLFQVVSLQLLLRPVLSHSLDGQIESLSRRHKSFANLIGIMARKAWDAADELLRLREGRLALAALEENSLFREAESAGSDIKSFDVAKNCQREVSRSRKATETWGLGQESDGADVAIHSKDDDGESTMR